MQKQRVFRIVKARPVRKQFPAVHIVSAEEEAAHQWRLKQAHDLLIAHGYVEQLDGSYRKPKDPRISEVRKP